MQPRQLMPCAASLGVLPISLQYVVMWAGGAGIAGTLDALDSETLYYALSILCLVAANLCAGLMTTACITAILVPVRGAAGARTTEVLGKLTFTSLARALVDLTTQSLL